MAHDRYKYTKKATRIWLLILIGILFISVVQGADLIVGYDSGTPVVEIGDEVETTINSTDYWDDLDTPADINLADLNNDAGFVTVGNITDLYVDEAGDNMTGDLAMNGNAITNIGLLTVQGLTQSQDIFPEVTNLYSLGNTTNWWKEIYVTTIYTNSIYASNINSTNINSTNIDSERINSTNVNVDDNLTIGEKKMYDESGTDTLVLEI